MESMWPSRRPGETTQWAVDAASGELKSLTAEGEGPTARAHNWSNSWASDNRRFAYASYRDGVWNLCWIDRVTRERKQITEYTPMARSYGIGRGVQEPKR